MRGAAAVLAMLALLAAALGGGPDQARAATTITVYITCCGYSPNVITLAVGDSLRFVNTDTRAHTAVSDPPLFDSHGLGPNDAYQFQFNTPGVWRFRSEPDVTYDYSIQGRDPRIYLITGSVKVVPKDQITATVIPGLVPSQVTPTPATVAPPPPPSPAAPKATPAAPTAPTPTSNASFPTFWVQTNQDTPLWSVPDSSATRLGTVPQGSFLLVLQPQVNQRLYVVEPKGRTFGWVDVPVVDLAVAGPPSANPAPAPPPPPPAPALAPAAPPMAPAPPAPASGAAGGLGRFAGLVFPPGMAPAPQPNLTAAGSVLAAPGLVGPLTLLNGKLPQLVDAAARSGVGLIYAPTTYGAWGYYSQPRGLVAVSSEFTGAPQDNAAAVLAHQLSLVQQGLAGQLAGGPPACAANERRAFQVARDFWIALFGPSGKGGAANDFEKEMNDLTQADPSSPSFSPWLTRSSAHGCAEPTPTPVDISAGGNS